MWPHRKRRWPTIDLYREGGSGVIKAVSERELDRLMSKATASGWSANGRPGWFAEHRDRFGQATLVVFGREGTGLWRSIATVVLADGSGGRFTLDVAAADLDALPDLDDRTLVTMAHRYLGTFPPINVDGSVTGPEAEGEEWSWERSVWKRWGES
jgi:hypothetical protein